MRIFKNTWFDKFARKAQITAGMLVAAIKRAELGLIDADLGGGLIKMKLVRTSSTTSKYSTTPNASTSETECCRPSNSRINRKSNPRVSTKLRAIQERKPGKTSRDGSVKLNVTINTENKSANESVQLSKLS